MMRVYDDIPPGLMVQIKSWENDGDFDNTVTLYGVKPSAIHGLINFLSIYKPATSRASYDSIGNKEIDGDTCDIARKALALVMLDNPAFINDLFPSWEYVVKPYDLGEAYSDVETELLGVGEEGERHRVFDSIEIFDVPAMLKNVTELYVHDPEAC